MKKERWVKLMQAFGLQDNLVTYGLLIGAYSEKHRYYHTSVHISNCLKWHDCVSDLVMKSKENEFALWFHDVIYNPHSASNELKSAELAVDFLRSNSVKEAITKRIHDLIMVTRHTTPVRTCDEALMVDIDLAILGAEADQYNRYEVGIRNEYKWVPNIIFRKKRKKVLASLLAREAIYRNDYFQKKLEKRARANIINAITSL